MVLLVDPESVGAWADALHEALSDLPKMRAMALLGSQEVRHRFSIERNLEHVLRISGLSNLA